MDISRTKSKDRESKTGIVGSPKKGGAGGKGTWGKGGVDDLITHKPDSKDPNFDSDEEDDRIVLHDVPISEAPSHQILRDYFIEADSNEAASVIKEKEIPRSEFVRRAVYLAMEYQPYERELVSKLLSDLYGNVITLNQYEEGFQDALGKLDDAILDIPLADEMLGKFIARAIVDEVLPPAFLKTCRAESDLAHGAASLAMRLVNDPHRSRKLEHIWGPGDLVSVKRLKQEVQHLINEFVANGDKKEADTSVRRLNAPSFHIQLVRYALRFAIESKLDADRKKILELLSSLSKNGLLSSDHIERGFKQCHAQLEDHKLDVPLASAIFDDLVKSAQTSGWLSADFK